jgi:hypothetical protein
MPTRDEIEEKKYEHPHFDLCEVISEISEECWCAGWLTECEYSIWSLLEDYRKGKPLSWGTVDNFCTDEYLLRLMSRLDNLQTKAKGWWYWDDTVIEEWVSTSFPGHTCKLTYGERFVTQEEWEKMYADHLHNQKHL